MEHFNNYLINYYATLEYFNFIIYNMIRIKLN